VGNIIGNRGFINDMSTQISDVTGQPVIAAGVLSVWTALSSSMQWL
jgi:hypothetical protein